jgi:type II secretory pathway pseudopilin PulG
VTTALTGRAAGYSFLELLFVVTLVGILTATAIPTVLAGVDDSRAYGAARYVAAQLQLARMQATSRAAHVAVRFEPSGGTFQFAVYADGNANGVRTTDVQLGTDRRIQAPIQLNNQFPGVDFGVLPGLPAVDSSSAPPDGDPIKLGASNMVSFSPIGSATSGSVYVLGRNHSQYVVRVLGETGRIRVLKFDAGTRKWISL